MGILMTYLYKKFNIPRLGNKYYYYYYYYYKFLFSLIKNRVNGKKRMKRLANGAHKWIQCAET